MRAELGARVYLEVQALFCQYYGWEISPWFHSARLDERGVPEVVHWGHTLWEWWKLFCG